MEENPVPVNLSSLKNILANAKKVMNKVENISPSTPIQKNSNVVNENYQSSGYDERDEREPEYNQYQPESQGPVPLQNFSTEHIMASKLPQNIKEAMINKPIPKISMANSTFSLEDVQDINPKSIPIQNKRVINENRGSNNTDMITISRTELKEIINETLMNFLKNNYEKTLTESVITKTINLLIKEGKINPRKKTIS